MEDSWFVWQTNPLYQDMLKKPIVIHTRDMKTRQKRIDLKRGRARLKRKRKSK